MEAIQIKKRGLEKELKEVIDRFHEENKGFEVYRITPVGGKTTNIHTGEIYISSSRLTVELQVL